jgi:hypothetical protein
MAPLATEPRLALDHLVIAARTLDEGVAWCDAQFGLRPEAGGKHALMGTHNRVFAIGTPMFPRAYLEIIAIDPDAPRPAHARWFDLDDASMQRALAQQGPRLVHWVARCDAIDATLATLGAAGIECGDARPAERATPQGLLRWRISVRADGRRPLGGVAPSLIEWTGNAHPTDALAPSGVELRALCLGAWPAALARLLPAAIETDTRPDAPALRAVLAGPRGRVTLSS